MPQTPATEEPLTIAVRCQERLTRAFTAIGIEAGTGGLRLYADVNPLGSPIVVLGPLTVEATNRLSTALEGAQPVDVVTATALSGEEACDAEH